MGKLLVGRPTLAMEYVVSAPLDLVETLVLVYRAPEMGSMADAWSQATRAALPESVAHDLDTLYGCSGRSIAFAEEVLMTFAPLAPAHREATYADYRAFLAAQPPEWFGDAFVRAVRRGRNETTETVGETGVSAVVPSVDDHDAWETFLAPAITRADVTEAAALACDPPTLKCRLLALYDAFEEQFHAADFAVTKAALHGAAERAERLGEAYLEEAFADMTGSRLPPEIEHAAREVARATFVPCTHLGPYLSYILYPPELIVFFDAAHPLGRPVRGGREHESSGTTADLIALRALADGTRLHIVSILQGGELYAQEVVARLGISQSAVSRHLSMLEAAGIVRVRPANGMKYYAVNPVRLRQLAESLNHLAD